MRLIDGDALLKHECEADSMGAMLVVGKGYILDAPTINTVRGEWTYEINEYFRTCSVCRISQALLAGENLSRFKYCPFCGAKMEKEEVCSSLQSQDDCQG